MTKDFNSENEAKNETRSMDSTGASSSAEKIGAFEPLRISNFRFLLSGSILAFAINWIQQVIISWLVYDITGSGTILGSTILIMSAASLCMLPVVGLIVDTFNRRMLLLIETACMFVITLGLGLLLVTGHSSLIYIFIFAFICGLIQSVDSNLRQVLVFDIVPRALTPGAMGLNQTGWSVMRFLGPSMGGFLLIWSGAGGSFLIQAAGYIIIALTILQLRLPERKREPVRSSPMQNIKEGWGFLVRTQVTRTFTLIGIIMPILVIPIFVTLPPIYAVKVFGDPTGKVLGFLMASVGVGGVIGGVATTYLRRLERWGLMQLASIFLVSLTLIAFAFNTQLWLALVLLVLAGFFEIIFLTMNQTLIQLSIPDDLRSRVTAVVSLSWMLAPVGSFIAGAGSDLLGGPEWITLILSGASTVIVVLIMIFSPTVRNYRLSQAISTSGTPPA
jgi:MFS family permease